MDVRLIYFLYRGLQLVTFPFILLYLLLRGIRDKRYFHHLAERFGLLAFSQDETIPGGIWLHAVSVGEVLSAVGLLRQLRREMPSVPLYISTSTVAGRTLAQQRLASVVNGIFYAPIDYCFAIRRVLRAVRPSVVVAVETEIWPNLFREARRAGCGLLVVNARISDNAFPRYRRFRWLFQAVLREPHWILAQTEVSRRRYLELGAPTATVRLAGNLKYDFDPDSVPPSEPVVDFIRRYKPRAVWIAASTMPPAEPGDVDEDDVVIRVFRQLAGRVPDLLLILAPRKPERFDEVARKLAQAGVNFVRRSEMGNFTRTFSLPGILLLDSIGELTGLFRLGDVVFVGGTLARRGGHNILEPAFFARAIIIGPHMENFPEIGSEFRQNGACVPIQGPDELAGAVTVLLDDEQLRGALGQKALSLAQTRKGATAIALKEISSLYSVSFPSVPRVFPLRLIYRLLARTWRIGGRLKAALDSRHCERLNTFVISVGNLTMGGSGKTPFTLWMAKELKSAGFEPAILTRGYRRLERKRPVIVAPGESRSVRETGDEAQIFIRSVLCPVGIGADRVAAGRLIEEHFHPTVFLLDDGFQHRRLERQLDIVLLDALDPFGGGNLFPLGRLREPLQALARANAFVITRAGGGRPVDGIIAKVREYNCSAPFFLARVVPKFWLETATGKRWDVRALSFVKVVAFCGLGTPGSFWQTLEELGCRPVRRWSFPDHHRYSQSELNHMAEEAKTLGAEALLTTEKDLMNLPCGTEQQVAPLKFLFLRIEMEVLESEKLVGYIKQRISESGFKGK